ncbi:MAG: flagellar basal-body rod protein FlgG [Solirubrobacteraceae bacterium]|jgi:flagellar basal-body rod protein FlgG|nr:flagellar basal-body rod protein FlgG [Solirubrobacteraceae bacterium]
MLEGLYSAAAGMQAQQQRMDSVANDLANANTNGYKKTRVAFRDLLYVRDASGNVQSGAGTAATTIGRGFSQGALSETGNPLDLAIENGGFLQIRRADGTNALTRDGSLRLDPRGRLTTQRGELLQPAVTVPAGTKESDLQIASDGTITANSRQVGRIQVVNVQSPEALQSIGDNLFRATAASGAPRALATGRVTQGSVEGSNVDVADSMTEMMDAQRSFQLASKAVQMQDQLLQIANSVKA